MVLQVVFAEHLLNSNVRSQDCDETGALDVQYVPPCYRHRHDAGSSLEFIQANSVCMEKQSYAFVHGLLQFYLVIKHP